mmetsp:Transcript_7276/g.13132  ORF Transcript_7276/g.13132 Transcript_7276/m.13132 type:complete len:241 (+) Transcript_7276:425-1147(+)
MNRNRWKRSELRGCRCKEQCLFKSEQKQREHRLKARKDSQEEGVMRSAGAVHKAWREKRVPENITIPISTDRIRVGRDDNLVNNSCIHRSLQLIGHQCSRSRLRTTRSMRLNLGSTRDCRRLHCSMGFHMRTHLLRCTQDTIHRFHLRSPQFPPRIQSCFHCTINRVKTQKPMKQRLVIHQIIVSNSHPLTLRRCFLWQTFLHFQPTRLNPKAPHLSSQRGIYTYNCFHTWTEFLGSILE